mgnify:CR=1 FL=1
MTPASPGLKRTGCCARLLQGRVAPVLLSFFRLLSQRERLPLLPAILKSYHLLCLKAENGAQALYRCAREPDLRTWPAWEKH